jgi:hypothetical protein
MKPILWSIVGAILITLSTAFFIGCENDPIKTEPTTNKNIRVDFLFEHEGCRVYRFVDSETVYYANCGSQSQTSWERSCGKGCIKHETVSTSGNS